MKEFKLNYYNWEERNNLKKWFYIDDTNKGNILFYRDNQWKEIRINIPEKKKNKIIIEENKIKIDNEILEKIDWIINKENNSNKKYI